MGITKIPETKSVSSIFRSIFGVVAVVNLQFMSVVILWFCALEHISPLENDIIYRKTVRRIVKNDATPHWYADMTMRRNCYFAVMRLLMPDAFYARLAQIVHVIRSIKQITNTLLIWNWHVPWHVCTIASSVVVVVAVVAGRVGNKQYKTIQWVMKSGKHNWELHQSIRYDSTAQTKGVASKTTAQFTQYSRGVCVCACCCCCWCVCKCFAFPL